MRKATIARSKPRQGGHLVGRTNKNVGLHAKLNVQVFTSARPRHKHPHYEIKIEFLHR